jgi:hypothetical protein
MKQLKYKTSFCSVIKPVISTEVDKYLSLASIDKLRPFLPKDENIVDNPAFLSFCGNGFVANRSNLNGDMVGTNEAISLAENCKLGFIDLSHNRKQIIGIVLEAGYSEFGTDKPLTKEQILKDYQNIPFNVVISGIIWRAANSDLADYIEESGDPESSSFGEVSLSWEIMYAESEVLLLPSNAKNKEDGTIVKDEAEKTKFEKLLKVNGGNGTSDNGQDVVNLIIGETLCLGFGLVEDPAAEVRGILTPKSSKINIKASNNDNILDKIENSSSHIQKPDVKIEDINKKTPMKLASIKDLTDENLKEVKASELTALFESEIKKISDNYVEKMNEDKNSIKASSDKTKELEQKLADIQKNYETVQSQLNEVINSNAAREKEDVFTARMASLDELYDLSAEDREIVGDMIKDLDTDKYTSVVKKLDTLLAAKKKSGKVFDKKTMKWVDPKEVKEEEKEVKASITEVKTENVVTEVIDKGEKKGAVAATATVTETLADKFKKAFSADNWVAKEYRGRKS